jgi:hypothetical protein
MKLQDLFEKKISHSGQGHGYNDYNTEFHQRHLDNRKDLDIGPHEGKELNMMLAKDKPAALVDDDKYHAFEKYVKDGILISKSYINRDGYRDWVVVLPGEENRIPRIIALLTAPFNSNGSESMKLYHAKLGKLLGYTNEQIRKFIAKT